MSDPAAEPPRKIPLVFYRSNSGADPVKDWLKTLPSAERQVIGQDLMRVQWRWPVGMPLCRPMGQGFGKCAAACREIASPRVLLRAPGDFGDTAWPDQEDAEDAGR